MLSSTMAMEDNQATGLPCKQYSNFVKASQKQTGSKQNVNLPKISGLEAKRMYLEEVADLTTASPSQNNQTDSGADHFAEPTSRKAQSNISTKDLITAVQNNDSKKVRMAIKCNPDRVNTVDEFGWSLLMIACQANSVETVKELLKRGADLSFRDKAGNSARSLVIKNRSAALASLIIGYKDWKQNIDQETQSSKKIITEMSEFTCDICDGRKFTDERTHIASTLHNINLSKGRKMPPAYGIPESNKGFQIMLRSGWDKEGLGASGSGIKYPIKCKPKKDRKGLGNEKRKKKESKTTDVSSKHKTAFNDKERDRFIEVNFRREFY